MIEKKIQSRLADCHQGMTKMSTALVVFVGELVVFKLVVLEIGRDM
ncbi:MAG: hypothetical protein QW512_00770 [Thermofilaceae archaeon]